MVVSAADILKGARAAAGAHGCQNRAQGAEVVPVVVSAADILKAKTLYIYKVINI